VVDFKEISLYPWRDNEKLILSVSIIENYWEFGLCPSSGILEAGNHNVSEIGSVSVLR
jgi:hypothetical protein